MLAAGSGVRYRAFTLFPGGWVTDKRSVKGPKCNSGRCWVIAANNGLNDTKNSGHAKSFTQKVSWGAQFFRERRETFA